MEKLELRFTAPKVLNELKESQSLDKKQWFFGGDESMPLLLDIDNWIIHCDANNTEAHITNWKVNQDKNAMIVEEDENYENITFSFSASMLGQIVKKDDLIRFLGELQEVFQVSAEERSNEESENNQNE